jgi:hypothetical protein
MPSLVYYALRAAHLEPELEDIYAVSAAPGARQRPQKKFSLHIKESEFVNRARNH